MLFDRIRAWFSDPSGAENTQSSSRADLASVFAEQVAAGDIVKDREGRVALLKSLIEAGPAAERELQTLIARPSGVAELAAFSTGEDNGLVAHHVSKAAHAAQAADAARGALPEAERALAAAIAQVGRLEDKKRARIGTIMIEDIDRIIAQRVIEDFRNLCSRHDLLVGAARALNSAGYGDIIMADADELEVPRSRLPSLACGAEGYSTFLKHVPDGQTKTAAQVACTRFARRLAVDPYADIGAAFSPDLLAEVGPHPEHASSITITRRPDPPVGNIEQIIQEQKNKERRMFNFA